MQLIIFNFPLVILLDRRLTFNLFIHILKSWTNDHFVQSPSYAKTYTVLDRLGHPIRRLGRWIDRFGLCWFTGTEGILLLHWCLSGGGVDRGGDFVGNLGTVCDLCGS